MKLVFPKLELQSGTTLCLHIPPGFHDQEALVEEEILKQAHQQGKTAIISKPATRRAGLLERFRKRNAIEWLAHEAETSKGEAALIVAEYGIPIALDLSIIPGTPRCLLGIAAALARKPQVLVYSTAGLDPAGRIRVHQFLAPRRSGACFIHLSWPSFKGTGEPAPRSCPEGVCVLMFGEEF